MQVELDRRTFERLVKLYLLTMPAAIALIVFELLSPHWTAFSDEYDLLVESHFSLPAEPWQSAGLAIGVAAGVWHVASAFGLLWYKRWARSGFWASLLAGILASFLLLGLAPAYRGVWSDLLIFVGSMLMGSILLLAYSRTHGGDWFMKPLDRLKETF